MTSSCERGSFWGVADHAGLPTGGGQAELVRVPLADGTLGRVPEPPDAALVRDYLALSDVYGTGDHAAWSAGVGPDDTVVVVGDGAVAQCAVLSARHRGAARVVVMSTHPQRAELAVRLGATDVVAARGAEGARAVRELLGDGADAVLECVGTSVSVRQGVECARPGGVVGYVGWPHGVQVDLLGAWQRNIALVGGIAPIRGRLDSLIDQVHRGHLRPGAVFDREYALADAGAGYRDMAERRTLKALLRP